LFTININFVETNKKKKDRFVINLKFTYLIVDSSQQRHCQRKSTKLLHPSLKGLEQGVGKHLKYNELGDFRQKLLLNKNILPSFPLLPSLTFTLPSALGMIAT
jgi:hypothetical protein